MSVITEPDLHEHQLKALRRLANGKILWGGVGSGKSRVAVEYYRLREAPRRVYVITTAKKRDSLDWEGEFYRVNIGPASGPVVSRSSGQVPRTSHAGKDLDEAGITTGHRLGSLGGTYPWVLTVDSWNNINKYAGVEGAFFIFDEQRLVGSGQWAKSFLRISRRNHWILLSATPGDTWMDYVPVFVANNFYKNRTEFKREHVVYNTFSKFPKVDRYINVGRLVRQRSELLVEMPYMRHTRRRHVEVPLPYDKEALDLVLKKRWHVYENRPLRDVGEMFSVARRIVNSDPSRLEMVKELWKIHPKLIVFYNFNYELEILRSLSNFSPNNSTENASGGFKPSLRLSSKTESPLVVSKSSTKTIRKTGIASGSTSSPEITENQLNSEISLLSKANERCLTTKDGSRPTSLLSPCEASTRSGIENSTTGTSSTTVCSVMGNTGSPKSSSRPVVSPSNNSSDKIWNGPSKLSKRSGHDCTCMEKSEENLGESSTTTSTEPSRTTGSTEESQQGFAIAEWNGHKHQPIPSTDRWLYLVQYVAGAEAWECIETDATIMYSRTYSWKIFEQACGRMDRMNTPFNELWYYGFTSDSWIDRAIGRSLKAKKTFNEAKYAGLFKG